MVFFILGYLLDAIWSNSIFKPKCIFWPDKLKSSLFNPLGMGTYSDNFVCLFLISYYKYQRKRFSGNTEVFTSELLENLEEMFFCVLICLACLNLQPHIGVLSTAKGLGDSKKLFSSIIWNLIQIKVRFKSVYFLV